MDPLVSNLGFPLLEEEVFFAKGFELPPFEGLSATSWEMILAF
jgi:hypothetical protein